MMGFCVFFTYFSIWKYTHLAFKNSPKPCRASRFTVNFYNYCIYIFFCKWSSSLKLYGFRTLPFWTILEVIESILTGSYIIITNHSLYGDFEGHFYFWNPTDVLQSTLDHLKVPERHDNHNNDRSGGSKWPALSLSPIPS